MNLQKLFVFGIRQQEPPPVDWTGVLLFKNNMPDVDTTRELTKSLRGKRIIAVDCEGGNTTNVPNLFPLNPARSQYYPDNAALGISKHLKYLGINTNLAPVADLNSSERSLGEDPWEVGHKVRNVVMSYRASNIISCAKHFPGLSSDGDSHHENVSIRTPQLVPFFEAIRAGVPMVMMGHARCLDLGNAPSSRSARAYRLLREGLGFDGVIITDSLEMKGCGDNLYESMMDAFIYGADIMMISSAASPEEQYDAFTTFSMTVNESPFLKTRVQESINRVDKLLNKL